jgi:predicted nucleic acid-binding protein
MRFLDSNIFIRYLAADDAEKTDACGRLFQRIAANDEVVTTSESVISEVVYVLSSRSLYGLTRRDIVSRLRPLLALSSLRITDKQIYFRALDIYVSYSSLNFADAVSAAHVEHSRLTDIVSYDRGFDRVPGITRTEP